MLKIKKDVSLAQFTTFKVGGPAKFFVEVETREDLSDVFRWIHEKNEKYVILAGGSNVLVSDRGFSGIVIGLRNRDCVLRGDRIDCGAGSFLSKAVNVAISNNKQSFEWAIGIPGSIGGAVRGNAGAFGSEMSEIVETVEVYNIEKDSFETFSNRDCQFAYRDSIFKQNDNYLVWNTVLKLSDGNSQDIQRNVDKYISHRSLGQPKLPSAGCVFKNIIVGEINSENTYLLDLIREEGVEKGGKVGAGWVIDKLDLRGKKMGGAKISLEHANFIVNTSDARAEDIIMLISYIKQQVRDRFGIQLQEEIVYLGF